MPIHFEKRNEIISDIERQRALAEWPKFWRQSTISDVYHYKITAGVTVSFPFNATNLLASETT